MTWQVKKLNKISDKLNFIRNFPEIKEKDGKYYLYLGLVYGLEANQMQLIINDCLEQDIFKRKIILNKILLFASKWRQEYNEALFNKIYNSLNSLSTYFKKESASMILMALFPFVSTNNQNKLANCFVGSSYKNNHKRIYKYFYQNWTKSCKKIIEIAWDKFRDEEAIGLIIGKMPVDFLEKNIVELKEYFKEEELTYDFFRKILRNKFYARMYNKLENEIKQLKKDDPISYIAINKECGKKIDIQWAIEIYKDNSKSRFLARWYSDMDLWDDILKQKPNLLSDLKL
ncbi:MAG: hypothetical protein PHT91_03240 [Candidatus Nanoarchaeia archaeon]|nr:hypothetical protein [Candidatus Portnoybacteria bacterium]MDD4983003.1 hypothetical protein [Candidatus Portnoybacteria bacterium]MDD5499863.1 hypothetical protein [Candidatus Nanoarchaeia archaeon]